MEPEGLVEVKYKHKDLVKTIHRLDEITKKLDKKQAAIKEEIAQIVEKNSVAKPYGDIEKTDSRDQGI